MMVRPSPSPTHDDLNRALGRVEGSQDAMGDRLDRLGKMVSDGFSKVSGSLDDIGTRLDVIEKRESERAGAFKLGNWLAGGIAGRIAFIAGKVC